MKDAETYLTAKQEAHLQKTSLQKKTYLKNLPILSEESFKPIELDSALVVYSNVSEDTQCSVLMQREIETRTKQMQIGNGLNFLPKTDCNSENYCILSVNLGFIQL